MVLVAVACIAAQPRDDAGVLDRVIGIVEHRAADAYTGLAALPHHLGEPVAVDDLDIVVEQQQVFTRRVLAAEIVDAAEVEPALVGHNAGAVVPVGQALVVVCRGRVGRVVLNDDDLEVFIGRFGVDAVQALLQIIGVILVRDQDRDKRLRFGNIPHHMAGAGEKPGLHPALPPGGGQMVGYGPLCGLLNIGLGCRAAAGGGRMHAPIVQHLRDVQRFGGRVAALHLIHKAQKEIVILCAVTRRAFAADRVKQRFFEYGQMADVVDRHQVFGGVVGLEVADTRMLGRFLKQGLIAVGKGHTAFGKGLAHAVHCVGGQHVIVVGQG